MIYDTVSQRARNRQLNSFVFDCMSVSEEFLEIRKLHLSPKQSTLMYKWRKKGKSWTFNNHIRASFLGNLPIVVKSMLVSWYFHLFFFSFRCRTPDETPDWSTVYSPETVHAQSFTPGRLWPKHHQCSCLCLWVLVLKGVRFRHVFSCFFLHCTRWSCFLNATISFRL